MDEEQEAPDHGATNTEKLLARACNLGATNEEITSMETVEKAFELIAEDINHLQTEPKTILAFAKIHDYLIQQVTK